MSTKNIVSQQPLPSGRSLLTFRVDDAEDGKPQFRHYSYGPRAATQIQKGKDPRKFKATEVKVAKEK